MDPKDANNSTDPLANLNSAPPQNLGDITAGVSDPSSFPMPAQNTTPQPFSQDNIVGSTFSSPPPPPAGIPQDAGQQPVSVSMSDPLNSSNQGSDFSSSSFPGSDQPVTAPATDLNLSSGDSNSVWGADQSQAAVNSSFPQADTQPFPSLSPDINTSASLPGSLPDAGINSSTNQATSDTFGFPPQTDLASAPVNIDQAAAPMSDFPSAPVGDASSPATSTTPDPSGFFNAPAPATPAAPEVSAEENVAANPFMSGPESAPAADTSNLMSALGASESAPTDLSHLVGDNSASVPTAASETVIIPPQAPAQDPTQVVTSSSGGFPKWILAVAVIVLLLVTAASAYFILGVGQNIQEEQPVLEPPVSAVISPAVIPTQPVEIATPSAGFGEFQGDTGPAEAIASPSGAASGSAFDRIRQRTSTP